MNEIKVGQRYKWDETTPPGDYCTITKLAEDTVWFTCDDGYQSDCNINQVTNWLLLDTNHIASKEDVIVNPPHYITTKISALDVVNDWKLDFYLGNTVKYIKRHELKGNPIQDLEKAVQYLQLKIELLKKEV